MNSYEKGIITIFGRPSSGKTIYSIELLSRIINHNDIAVAIFSLDLRPEQIHIRLGSKLRFSNKIYVEDNIGVYLSSFLEDAIIFKKKSNSNKLIVLIDYFQKLNFEHLKKTVCFEEELKFLMDLLAKISDQENIEFIINSRIPRNAILKNKNSEPDKEITFENLRECKDKIIMHLIAVSNSISIINRNEHNNTVEVNEFTKNGILLDKCRFKIRKVNELISLDLDNSGT